MRKWVIGLTILAVVSISVYISYLSYIGKTQVIEREPTVPFESFHTFSEDRTQTQINGWYLPAESCSVVVVVPGWSENRSILLDWAESWQKNGVSAVVYDPRGGTGRNTFGNLESKDLLGVLNWLNNEQKINSNRVILVGHSMGGAVAQLVAAERNLLGLVLVSGVYDLGQTRKLVFTDRGLWFPGFFALTNRVTDRIMYGIKTYSLENVWSKIEEPTLILHSTEDEKSNITLVQNRIKTKKETTLLTVNGNHRVFLDNKSARAKAAQQILEWTNQQACSTN